MGSDWLAGPVWLAKPPLECGMCSGCIVNNGVVYIAYQFEPDWDAEDISEEDCGEPVQARLLMVGLRFLLSHTFRYAVICKSYCFCLLLIYIFILIKALIQYGNRI